MVAQPGSGHSTTDRDFPDLCVAEGMLGPARWCVSSRSGGVSVDAFSGANLGAHVGDEPTSVASNRAAFAHSLGATVGLAAIRAEHGARVRQVDEPGDVDNVDALITSHKGLGLLALGADCAVVGLHGTRSDGTSLIAVAHCGWQGIVADVLGAVVGDLHERGAQAIEAIVGPAICGSCYRVSGDRCEEVRRSSLPEVAQATVVEDGQGFGLDIAAGAFTRLASLDVDVASLGICTYEDDRFFSYRRSGVTGRHGLGMVIV